MVELNCFNYFHPDGVADNSLYLFFCLVIYLSSCSWYSSFILNDDSTWRFSIRFALLPWYSNTIMYQQYTKTEPSTEIIGAPDLYIESGSTINLTCVIEDSPEPPAYIFWNHNNAVSIKKSILLKSSIYFCSSIDCL